MGCVISGQNFHRSTRCSAYWGKVHTPVLFFGIVRSQRRGNLNLITMYVIKSQIIFAFLESLKHIRDDNCPERIVSGSCFPL